MFLPNLSHRLVESLSYQLCQKEKEGFCGGKAT